MSYLAGKESAGHVGGIGGRSDESDKLEDMNYAERIILSQETLEMLGQLKNLTPENVENYTYLKFNKEDFDKVGYEAKTVGSFMQRVNSVFSLYRIPFYALTETSKDAPKDEEGKKVADLVKVFRYGEEFNPKKYSTLEAGRISKKSGEVISHEEPTSGMRLRRIKWLTMIAPTYLTDMLEGVGISVEEIEESEESE